MALPSVLTLSYWLNTAPPELMKPAFVLFLVVSVVLIAGAVTGFLLVRRATGAFASKDVRRAVEGSSWDAMWIGLVGLFLCFAADQRVPTISMRVWWVLWIVWVAWAGWKAWKRLGRDIPAAEAARAARSANDKWLPKSKK